MEILREMINHFDQAGLDKQRIKLVSDALERAKPEARPTLSVRLFGLVKMKEALDLKMDP